MSTDLVAVGIDQNIRQLIATSNDTFGLRKALKLNLRVLNKLQRFFDHDDDLMSHMKVITQLSTLEPSTGVSHINLSDLRRQAELAFLGKRLRRIQTRANFTNGVARPLTLVADRHTDQLEWSDFAHSLFCKLSAYDVQSERFKYNVAELDNFGQGDENNAQGISVRRDQLEVFFNRLVSTRLIQAEDLTINPKTLTDDWLYELNQLLEVTLKEDLVFEEHGDVLTFKRSFVCLKDVVAKIAGRTDFKTVRVFAAHTIYIDAHLELREKNVTFLAPYMQSTGANLWTVNISGRDALDHLDSAKDGELQQNELAVAPAQAKRGRDGSDAGNFFILFHKTDQLKLQVLADGGNGGRGQTGGRGIPGKDGKDVALPDNISPCYLLQLIGRSYQITKRGFGYISYLLFARDPGGSGSKGGAGGNGGRGGSSGVVATCHESIQYSTSPGLGGAGGAGGAGGKTGKDGRDATCTVTHYPIVDSTESYYVDVPYLDSKPGQVGDQGAQGSTGSVATVQRFAYDLSAFKAYMLAKSSNRLFTDALNSMIIHIDKLAAVDNYYDALSLVDECVQLIKHQDSADHTFELAIYKKLLEKIEKFASSNVNESTPKDELIVLQHLYASTLSKVCRLTRASEGFLIVNMDRALDNAIDNIEKVRSSQAALAVVSTGRHFADDIASMVREGQMLLENQVFPEIEQIMGATKARIADLLKELRKFEERLEDDKEVLMKLKYVVIVMAVLDGIIIIGKLIAALYGFGETAEFVGKVTSMGIHKLGATVADPNRPDKITKLPDGTRESMAKVRLEAKLKVENKADLLKARIGSILEIIREHLKTSNTNATVRSLVVSTGSGPDIGGLEQTMVSLEGELDAVQREAGDQLSEVNRKVDEISAKVDTAIKQQKDLADEAEQKAKTKEEKEKAEKESQAMKKAVSTAFQETCELVAETVTEWNKVEQASIIVDQELENVKSFRNVIMNTALPIMDSIFDNMRNLETDLASKSQLVLEFNKWQVKDKLSDLGEFLKQATKGFAVQDELARTIVKLDEAMTTTISMYDRMQTYYNQAKLAEHIAVIGGANLGEVDISNSELKEATIKMDVAARRNLLLEQYEASLAAMRQWVFPFADRYLAEFALPNVLKPDADLGSVEVTVVKGIQVMRSRVRDYLSMIAKDDQRVRTESFESNNVHSTPFYVWPGARNGAEIGALLSGKPVSLFANIFLSPRYKSAIKFNRIGLEFVSTANNQQELNRLLEGFEVNLTHSGTSYYRIQDSYYQIISTSLQIAYSIRRNQDGVPTSRNEVYSKLLSGDPMLSPYTLWTIQLTKASPSANFDALKPFASNLDLLLVGEAKYFNETLEGKRLELDRYNYERAHITEIE